ncbi:hypothetical protein [Lactococcus garvieae]|uniref:hypothetical protein n=1 Tax=Lactococcus garvieae TaxID=1363 RepID=UPI0028903095|nr:hypothetical protein [Lactococcus garvieae]MDT2740974.1 hypothetical protein [Lactococcus garvieae]
MLEKDKVEKHVRHELLVDEIKMVEKHLTEMSKTEYSKYILEPSQDLRRISLSGYYQFMKYKEKQNKKML